MTTPAPVRCRWCDRVLQVKIDTGQFVGVLVCPRCDMVAGVKQAGCVS